MKKFLLGFLILVVLPVSVLASDMLPAGGYYERTTNNCTRAAMQADLDRATADRRAVITVVKCAPQVTDDNAVNTQTVRRAAGCGCASCAHGGTIERVVSRRHYVEETVQRYEPVVYYVPSGTYTRTRRICTSCDM